MDMLILLLALLGGGGAGWCLRGREALVRANRHLTQVSIWALLFFMGTKMAAHRELFTKDLKLFFLAIASSVLLAGLFFLVFLAWAWLRRGHRAGQSHLDTPESGGGAGHELAAVGLNSGLILLGFLLFLALPASAAARLPLAAAGDWLLRLLLLSIGFELGVDLHKLDLRKLALPLLFLPLVNALASLACGALFSLFTRLSLRESLLLYAGLGWYSLSSVMIAGRGLALLGILAFIHNIFRELLTILAAPLAARISPYLPIYLGGATAMDVTLPFVQKYCGREYTLASFYSGVACSLAVVPLVRLLLG